MAAFSTRSVGQRLKLLWRWGSCKIFQFLVVPDLTSGHMAWNNIVAYIQRPMTSWACKFGLIISGQRPKGDRSCLNERWGWWNFLWGWGVGSERLLLYEAWAGDKSTSYSHGYSWWNTQRAIDGQWTRYPRHWNALWGLLSSIIMISLGENPETSFC